MKKTLLPSKLKLYTITLLQAPLVFTFTALSFIANTSHDSLTRSISTPLAWKQVFLKLTSYWRLKNGYLVIDETVINKSYSLVLPCLSWVFSNKDKKHVYGYHIVVLVWTNSVITIPLFWKFYIPHSGKTKGDLATELVALAINIFRIKPKAVLFDAFYASYKFLKFLKDRKLKFYSQVAKSRLFNGVALFKINKGRPYWNAVGYLKGGLEVKVVKRRRKYFITNSVGDDREKILSTYKKRWSIEEVFRFTKSKLGLEQCQSTNLQSQHNHIGSCFLLYAVLQDISKKKGVTNYYIKQKATYDKNYADLVSMRLYQLTA